MDLVEIAHKKDDLPICKVIDYDKFKFEFKKKEKIRKKANKIITKEIRLAATIEKHDFDFKKKNAIKLLKGGANIKVNIRFRRMRRPNLLMHHQWAKEHLTKMSNLLEKEGGKILQPIKLEGRQMFTIIAALKKK